MKEYILRLQIQQSSSFMSVAPLDSVSFDKKTAEPLGFASSALFFLQE